MPPRRELRVEAAAGVGHGAAVAAARRERLAERRRPAVAVLRRDAARAAQHDDGRADVEAPERLARQVEEVGEVGDAGDEDGRARDDDAPRGLVREERVREPALDGARLQALLDLRDAVLLPEVEGLVADEPRRAGAEEVRLGGPGRPPAVPRPVPRGDVRRERAELGLGRRARGAVDVAERVERVEELAVGQRFVADERRRRVRAPGAAVEALDVGDGVAAEPRAVGHGQVAEAGEVLRRAEVVVARGGPTSRGARPRRQRGTAAHVILASKSHELFSEFALLERPSRCVS